MIELIFAHPWIWIVAIVIGVFLLFSIGMTVWWFRERGTWDAEGPGIAAVIGWLATLILAGVYFGFMLPPYDTSFHATYRITGEISEIEKGFTGDGDGVFSSGFVVGVEGVDDYLIWSDDQRFRTLEVGDEVNLVCGKIFRYFQEPYYDCSFGG